MTASLLRAYVRHGPAGRLAADLAEVLDKHLQHHPVTAIAYTRYGARIPVTTNDLIQRYLYMFGTWEPNLTCLDSKSAQAGRHLHRRRVQHRPFLPPCRTTSRTVGPGSCYRCFTPIRSGPQADRNCQWLPQYPRCLQCSLGDRRRAVFLHQGPEQSRRYDQCSPSHRSLTQFSCSCRIPSRPAQYHGARNRSHHQNRRRGIRGQRHRRTRISPRQASTRRRNSH